MIKLLTDPKVILKIAQAEKDNQVAFFTPTKKTTDTCRYEKFLNLKHATTGYEVGILLTYDFNYMQNKKQVVSKIFTILYPEHFLKFSQYSLDEISTCIQEQKIRLYPNIIPKIGWYFELTPFLKAPIIKQKTQYKSIHPINHTQKMK